MKQASHTKITITRARREFNKVKRDIELFQNRNLTKSIRNKKGRAGVIVIKCTRDRFREILSKRDEALKIGWKFRAKC